MSILRLNAFISAIFPHWGSKSVGGVSQMYLRVCEYCESEFYVDIKTAEAYEAQETERANKIAEGLSNEVK